MKINDNIKTENLSIRYDVAALGTAQFEEALNNGIIFGLIQANADEATGGDVIPVINQLLRNISSKRCNDKKRDVISTGDKRVMDMALLYESFLKSCKAEIQKSAAAIEGSTLKRTKPWHEFSKDEVMAMSLEDLRKYKNSLASYQSKQKGTRLDEVGKRLDALHDTMYLWTCDLYSKKAAEAKATKVLGIQPTEKAELPKVGDDIMAKLTSGKAASLTKEQTAQLAELLKLLQG